MATSDQSSKEWKKLATQKSWESRTAAAATKDTVTWDKHLPWYVWFEEQTKSTTYISNQKPFHVVGMIDSEVILGRKFVMMIG